jgi:hypothetical protein
MMVYQCLRKILPFFQTEDEQLNKINHKLDVLIKGLDKMAIDLTALQAQVAQVETVEASAVALITSIVNELHANSNDPAAVQALADRLKAATDPLAAAVAANTPAAPAAQ